MTCDERRAIAFTSPHKIINVGYFKNIFKADTFWPLK